MPAVHLELGAVLTVDPVPVQLHLDGARPGQVVAHGHKADQVVRKFVLVPCVLRHHGIGGLQTQDAVFSGLVVVQRFVIRRHNTAHDIASYAAASAAVNFTLNVRLSDIETYWSKMSGWASFSRSRSSFKILSRRLGFMVTV